jgi:hypothetical protein
MANSEHHSKTIDEMNSLRLSENQSAYAMESIDKVINGKTQRPEYKYS